MFIDLDGFKSVNDTFGHAAGDQLLCSVGARLRACAPEAVCVARLGGDEFALLVEAADVPTSAITLASRVSSAIAEHFTNPSLVAVHAAGHQAVMQRAAEHARRKRQRQARQSSL